MTKVYSPVDGTVKKILVEDNQLVIAGDDVVVIEAMGLEMPVLTLKTGIVMLHTKEGDKVKTDQVLLEVNEEK